MIPPGLIAKVAPYRPILILAAVAALSAFCLYLGYQWGSRALPEAVVKQQEKVIETQAKRADVSAATTVKYVDRIVTVREEARVIIQEVPKYVPNDCVLPDSVRVFHNAAATGRLPAAARAGDAPGKAAEDAAR